LRRQIEERQGIWCGSAYADLERWIAWVAENDGVHRIAMRLKSQGSTSIGTRYRTITDRCCVND
jgi:hypothetical protein